MVNQEKHVPSAYHEEIMWIFLSTKLIAVIIYAG